MEDYSICDEYRSSQIETAITVEKVCRDFPDVFTTEYSEDGYCAGEIIKQNEMTASANEARCAPGMLDPLAAGTCEDLQGSPQTLIGGSAECMGNDETNYCGGYLFLLRYAGFRWVATGIAVGQSSFRSFSENHRHRPPPKKQKAPLALQFDPAARSRFFIPFLAQVFLFLLFA